MTWARNFGDSHRGSIGSLDTKRAKKIIKRCLDCGTGIEGPGKKRCAPCYDIVLQARNRANSKRHHLAKKAKNGANA